VLNTPYQDRIYLNTQLQKLSSAGLLSRVVKTLDLEHNQAFTNPQSLNRRSTWESLRRMFGFGSKGLEKPREVDEVPLTTSITPATSRTDLVEINRIAPFIEMLQGGLSVKQVNETRIIEITYRHLDPELATKIINTIADTFVQSNLEKKTETSSSAGDFLQKRIAELQSDIRTGEEQLINYGKNHQILSLDGSQNTVVDRLAGLNRQLLEAENDRKMAEAAYRAALQPGAATAIVEGKQGTESDAKLTELRQKRAQLLVEYTEKYPEIKEIDQQIAVLEKQAKESKSRSTSVVTTNLETAYKQALAREQALRADFNRQRSETLTQNEAAVNYRIIQQEIETNKSLLDGLLQRAKENDVVLAGTPNNIHVLDYAPRPKAPIGPRRMQGVVLAALFSLIFGVALARYLDYLDDSVHNVDDVEKTLHLPALAVIPAIGRLKRRRLLPQSKTALQKRNGNGSAEPLLLNTNGHSPLAEAYRQLRTSVLLSSAGGAPKTLLVTSSQPAEGKTTTVVNTATILAQTGASVLIIDGDMRRPRVHSIFGMENRHGLSTILASELSEAEMLQIVSQHEESGLYVLTSGPIPPNPAELLGSDQMRRLLAALEATFTHIIIDSPPVASFTDGVLISSVADGVLLVVHGGEASRAIVRRSRQLLQDVGAKIFGVVLNNVNLRAQDYYYQQYYQHYYSSSEADAGSAA
ncbi:MAG TPA: polysaccharide biosynthesis tyrosine autokinase, partial [Pyrinomonadaceae bacterium]|nr:polysaccharide biosynthesis tyrosine autokinase [Pyrinomonadaceae bacterium]